MLSAILISENNKYLNKVNRNMKVAYLSLSLIILLLVIVSGCSKTEITSKDSQEYKCPNVKGIDCMPVVSDENAPYCEPNYRRWIQENCKIEYSD